MRPRPTILVQVFRALVVTLAAQATLVVAAPSVTVPPDLAPVFAVLVGAHPGTAPEAVASGGELVLARGGVDWRDARSVAVLPDVVLTLVDDTPDGRALLRFAASPAAQRAFIDAGMLPASVTVTDQGGRTFEVRQPVERIVSPFALAVYLPYGLGAGDRVVMAAFQGARDAQGAAAMTRIDPRFPELNTLAPQETTNVERIATILPDLVFASARSEWIPSVEALGIPVMVFEGETVERLRDAMRLAGSVLGPDAAARAEAWSAYYDDVLARVAAATPRRTRVLFTGTQRTRVASGAMYQTAIIEAAGGSSVSKSLGGYWNDVGFEQVAVWDPDLILVPQYGGASVAAVLEDPEWRLLRAVRDANVLRVPKLVAPWDTPVPDSVLAVVWLAEVLAPGSTGLSCADETLFFYERFYGYAISAEEIEGLCGR